ncbi:hypothetical protein INR49_032364 [Caranx melampygus]|nr:hypothetical protein INR49_032364 [Caranx melampygus]
MHICKQHHLHRKLGATTHLPFAMALFTVAGRENEREGKKRGQHNDLQEANQRSESSLNADLKGWICVEHGLQDVLLIDEERVEDVKFKERGPGCQHQSVFSNVQNQRARRWLDRTHTQTHTQLSLLHWAFDCVCTLTAFVSLAAVGCYADVLRIYNLMKVSGYTVESGFCKVDYYEKACAQHHNQHHVALSSARHFGSAHISVKSPPPLYTTKPPDHQTSQSINQRTFPPFPQATAPSPFNIFANNNITFG